MRVPLSEVHHHFLARGCSVSHLPRYHPSNDDVLYTVINTVPSRERGRKAPARQGYVSKWDTQSWAVEKQKKVGDKGLTAFDVRFVEKREFQPVATVLKDLLVWMGDFWAMVLQTCPLECWTQKLSV